MLLDLAMEAFPTAHYGAPILLALMTGPNPRATFWFSLPRSRRSYKDLLLCAILTPDLSEGVQCLLLISTAINNAAKRSLVWSNFRTVSRNTKPIAFKYSHPYLHSEGSYSIFPR